MNNSNYVLITPARNEALYIEDTIKSIVSQTILPTKWVIVSDGSQDGTDDIVRKYSKKFDFIKLVHINSGKDRNFESKVKAFRLGYQKLASMQYNYIGNLDADVTFGSDFFRCLLRKFIENPKLGIAGGDIYELKNGKYRRRTGNRFESVAGAVLLFSSECYQRTGGFYPLKLGGEDTFSQVKARMSGWEVRSFSDLKVFHHKKKTMRISVYLRSMFYLGVKDYMLGYHPLYLLTKCIRRLFNRPILLGSLLRFIGFCYSTIQGKEKDVPSEFIQYIRHEQIKKLWSLIF